MEKGLEQRVTALNRFLHDVYHDQEIIKAGIDPGRADPRQRAVPARDGGRRRARRHLLAHRRHRHRARRQRRRQRQYYVLEDNLRVPSGVSYMLENRKMMMRLFPELFSAAPRRAGRALSRPAARDPARGRAAGDQRADRRGAHARHVQQRLLRARLPGAADGRRAGRGAGPVRQGRLRLHAHHARPAARRRDLPPRRRRLPRPAGVPPDSTLGCAGLLRAYRAGNVTLCQRHRHRRRRRQVDLPVRAGDDRVLPRREADPATTCRPTCAATPDDLEYVLAHLHELVVKEVHGAGGYGMLVGPAATQAEIEDFRSARAWPTRRATSRSRRWRCRPARPSSSAASRRATSTCGRSCCRARRCRWCPAA